MLNLMPQSPSSLAMFTQCPAKYYSKYITKMYVDDGSSPALVEGNKFHKAMEDAIGSNKPLPPKYSFMQSVVDLFTAERKKGSTVLVEVGAAIDAEGNPVDFWSKSAALRCKIDAVIIRDGHAFIFDWKTGKKRDYNEQLAINVVCAKACFRVEKVFTFFAFVKHDEFTMQFIGEHGHYTIIELEESMEKIREAHATGNFPPVPSALCRAWCGNMQCEFNGKL